MARVEKDAGLQQTVGELKQEVVEMKKEEVKPARGRSKKRGCCLVFLVVFLFAVGAIIWGLAASGFVTIPAVSAWAYKIPTPLHIVSAGPPLEAYISETFGSVLTDRLQAGTGSLNDRSVELSLPENSITTSFRTILKDSNLQFFDSEKAQVAIDAGQGVEIFLPLADQANNNALRLLVKLGVKDGLLVLDSAEMKIGSLTIPSWLSNLAIKPLANQGLASLNQQIGRYASIEKIETLPGVLKVFGTLTVEIMNLK